MARRLPPVWTIIARGRSWPGILSSEVPQGPIIYPPTPPGPPEPDYVTYQGIQVSYMGDPVTYLTEEIA